MVLSMKRVINALSTSFLVAPLHVDNKERWRAFLGASFGIVLTAVASRWLQGGGAPVVWLVAPMGASAVIVFALPASPMAQPWAVLGGNTISALAGIACANTIADPALAASVGVGSAVALMFLFRCLHPPGGATALLVVILHITSYKFALYPVLLNATLLVIAGMIYNNLTGRAYPHTQRAPVTSSRELGESSRFSPADLDVALARYNQVLDVSRDDLTVLLHHAELAAYQRNMGELRCADIMSPDPLAVQFGTDLNEAWSLMRQRHIKALPVIDRSRRIVGIVTPADFMRQIDLDEHQSIGMRLKTFLQRDGSSHSDKSEVVGQIMTRRVQVANLNKHAIELVPLFSKGGHQHIPVIDDENRLVGIITQSDLLRALYRAVAPADEQTNA